MADADNLLAEFIAADRTGSVPDPRDFLVRVDEPERTKLEGLIDEYLASAPRRPFDAAAFATSPALAIADDLARVIVGQSGSWPNVLPALRHRAQLKRSELVTRLAVALGAAGHEAKVGAYYHRMEQGSLPASGVSDRVLEALGAIVGESAERLRAAGRSLGAAGGAPPAATAGAFFARVAQPDETLVAASMAPPAPMREPADHDFVDDLFTGG